jgi:hypothetical protein
MANEYVDMSTPALDKKTISCMIAHKKSLKLLSVDEEDNRLSFMESDSKLHANKSEAKLNVKRKPLQIKNFFHDSNPAHNK